MLTSQLWHDRLPGYRLRRGVMGAASYLPVTPYWWRVLPYTLLTWARASNLERLARQTLREGVPGVFVECGTARGGSALLLGLILTNHAPDRALWLFDTFEGLPEGGDNDPDRAEHQRWVGQLRGPIEEIRALLKAHQVTVPVQTIKGLYQDTMPVTAIPQIAFLHLDADWYDSTMTCLQHLWPHISPGGFVQIDDYGSFEGCRKATHAFFGEDGPELHRIDEDGVWLQKPRVSRTR